MPLLAALPRFNSRIPVNLITNVARDIQAKLERAKNSNRTSRHVYVNLLKKHLKLTVQRVTASSRRRTSAGQWPRRWSEHDLQILR